MIFLALPFFSTLASADKTKKISLIFDTMEIYTGFLKEIDDNGLIHLMNPGAIALQFIPLEASSLAVVFVSAIRPALDAA